MQTHADTTAQVQPSQTDVQQSQAVAAAAAVVVLSSRTQRSLDEVK